MDFHDISLPGSVSLGTNKNNGQDAEKSVLDKVIADVRSDGGLFRRLLRPSMEKLGSLYRNHRAIPGPSSTASESEYQSQLLKLRLNEASTQDEWLAAAVELDAFEGADDWKEEEKSAEYDVALVRSRLETLVHTRLEGDQGRILLLVRTALTRNLGGMGDLRLYKHCRVGTKALIERYIEGVQDILDTLVDISTSEHASITPQKVLHSLLETRQSFGRSALLLSGGGTFGMNHIGVVKALFEANLLPRIISGASAGSIVCSVLCTKTDQEIPLVLKEFCYGDLAVFEKEGEETSLLNKAMNFMTQGSLFDISHLVRVMKDLLGDMTFLEAHYRTRRILNICVSPATLYEQARLLNYITSPHVMIWSAVAASCSVPFVFSAAQLFAKDPRTGQQQPWSQSPQKWIDGSVDNDIPTTRLAEMFNVNHFIVSQVNPHVVPFLEKNEEDAEAEALNSETGSKPSTTWMRSLTMLAKDEAMHRLQVLQELGVLPHAISKVRAILGQRYSGDITIFPKISYANFPRVLSNPTTDFMIEAMLSGERATWPKLSQIRNHVTIELALDDAVHKMMSAACFRSLLIDGTRSRAKTFDSDLTLSELRDHRLRQASREGHREIARPHRSSFDLPALNKSSTSFVLPKSASFRPISRSHPLPSIKVPGPDADFSTDSSTPPPRPHLWYDTDDEYSASSDSESEPHSPTAHIWPHSRRLFPSRSSPSTPSTTNKPLGISSSLPLPLKPASSSKTSTTNTTIVSGIARPSSPELRYKRLFHGSGVVQERSSSGANARSGPITASPKSMMNAFESRTGMLELDISGTKGMMRRRRRTLSTGIRLGVEEQE